MHNGHTSHIFILCNNVICTKSLNILSILYNVHIALNYTGYFVYSPLNSYVCIHWLLDFKYMLLLTTLKACLTCGAGGGAMRNGLGGAQSGIITEN